MRSYNQIPAIIKYIITTALLLSSCAPGPLLITRFVPAKTEVRQPSVLVFLPGRGGTINDFQSEGLFDSLHAAAPAIDFVSVEAPFAYYMNRSLLPRLEKGLFDSLHSKNYSDIWLMGNSMGGLGAILYARAYPGAINNLILLGPFLGDAPIVEEIVKSGGVHFWQPTDTLTDNYQRDVWIYLKKCIEDTCGSYPAIFLLAGTDDRFGAAHKLLAAAMPSSRVFQAAGGHDWNAWRSSFGAMMRSGEFKVRMRTLKDLPH